MMAQTLTNKYVDLDLSFLPNPITGDISILLDTNAVNASVKNLVITNHFERLFHPEIGSSVTGMLFNNATAFTSIYLQKAIEEVLTNFEPRVTLESVVVIVTSQQNQVQVTITYFINNITTPVNVTFFLDLLR